MTRPDQRAAVLRRAAAEPHLPLRVLFPATVAVAACRALPEFYAAGSDIGRARRAEAWRTLLDARAARTAALLVRAKR
ncbi:MAG: hypothetical protein AAFU61_08160 [Pseudomonadota bacterium]